MTDGHCGGSGSGDVGQILFIVIGTALLFGGLVVLGKIEERRDAPRREYERRRRIEWEEKKHAEAAKAEEGRP